MFKVRSWNLSVSLLVMVFSLSVGIEHAISQELYKSVAFTPAKSFIECEGPGVDKKGNLYAVNYSRKGTIGRVTPDGVASVFVELPAGSVGNGVRFDSKGNMLIADYTKHNILKVNMKTKAVSVFAHEPRMTQPNDIAIDSKDRLYASDPNFRGRSGRVWRIDIDGKVTLLDSISTPANGVAVSPDEKILYVNAARSIYAYDLSSEGQISNRRLLIEFPDGVMDGMRCDVDGNLYASRGGVGRVAKVSPDGKLLQEIQCLSRGATNVAFGGKDGRTIYVTNQGDNNIETFRVDRPGLEWAMTQKKKIK
jgi:gluconolactonase